MMKKAAKKHKNPSAVAIKSIFKSKARQKRQLKRSSYSFRPRSMIDHTSKWYMKSGGVPLPWRDGKGSPHPLSGAARHRPWRNCSGRRDAVGWWIFKDFVGWQHVLKSWTPRWRRLRTLCKRRSIGGMAAMLMVLFPHFLLLCCGLCGHKGMYLLLEVTSDKVNLNQVWPLVFRCIFSNITKSRSRENKYYTGQKSIFVPKYNCISITNNIRLIT